MTKRKKNAKKPCGCAARANPSDELPIEPLTVTPGEPAPSTSCLDWVRLERVPSEYAECMARLGTAGKISTAKDVWEVLHDRLEREDQEVGIVLLLDCQLNIRGAAEVSRGERESTTVPIADILRIALVDGATGLVFVHNHPTGSSTPSDDDKTTTVALNEACEAVGLLLVDHCILGMNGEYFSFADAGLLSSDLVMPPDPEPTPWVEPERDAVDNPLGYAVGDVVTLPAGTKVGMGKLREPVQARIDQLQTASDGSTFYGVSWTDAKTGKRRTTWWAPAAENPLVEDRQSGARRGWEHRRERDEWVVQNLDPALIPLWTRIGTQFRGTPEERYEAFTEYVHDHPGEANEALQAGADAWLDAEVSAGRARENPRGPRAMRYTSDQVTDMLANAAMWREQLTAAARERGYTGSSVAPFAEVIAFLRGAASNPRHFVSAREIGDRVVATWTWGGREYSGSGVLTKINPKSVKVQLTEDAGDHFRPGFVVTTTPDKIANGLSAYELHQQMRQALDESRRAGHWFKK